MKILIQFVKMADSTAMTQYVENKLEKLANKYDWIIQAQVYFKLEYSPSKKGKVCEIELSVPGPRIFAASDEHNYETAVKETISDLQKQLEKRKATLIHH